MTFLLCLTEITDLMLELYGGGKKRDKERPESSDQKGTLSSSSSPSVTYSPPVKKKVCMALVQCSSPVQIIIVHNPSLGVRLTKIWYKVCNKMDIGEMTCFYNWINYDCCKGGVLGSPHICCTNTVNTRVCYLSSLTIENWELFDWREATVFCTRYSVNKEPLHCN